MSEFPSTLVDAIQTVLRSRGLMSGDQNSLQHFILPEGFCIPSRDGHFVVGLLGQPPGVYRESASGLAFAPPCDAAHGHVEGGCRHPARCVRRGGLPGACAATTLPAPALPWPPRRRRLTGTAPVLPPRSRVPPRSRRWPRPPRALTPTAYCRTVAAPSSPLCRPPRTFGGLGAVVLAAWARPRALAAAPGRGERQGVDAA